MLHTGTYMLNRSRMLTLLHVTVCNWTCIRTYIHDVCQCTYVMYVAVRLSRTCMYRYVCMSCMYVTHVLCTSTGRQAGRNGYVAVAGLRRTSVFVYDTTMLSFVVFVSTMPKKKTIKCDRGKRPTYPRHRYAQRCCAIAVGQGVQSGADVRR